MTSPSDEPSAPGAAMDSSSKSLPLPSTPPTDFRVRNGCDTCRSSKVKCDETRPICSRCSRLGRTCIYQHQQQPLFFKTKGSGPLKNRTPWKSGCNTCRSQKVQCDDIKLICSRCGGLGIACAFGWGPNQAPPKLQMPHDTLSSKELTDSQINFGYDEYLLSIDPDDFEPGLFQDASLLLPSMDSDDLGQGKLLNENFIINGSFLSQLIKVPASNSNILLLDVRHRQLFTESRIIGSLCFDLPSLMLRNKGCTVLDILSNLTGKEDYRAFSRWSEAESIVVYYHDYVDLDHATLFRLTLEKFTDAGWRGNGYILREGFKVFAREYSLLIDKSPRLDLDLMSYEKYWGLENTDSRMKEEQQPENDQGESGQDTIEEPLDDLISESPTEAPRIEASDDLGGEQPRTPQQ